MNDEINVAQESESLVNSTRTCSKSPAVVNDNAVENITSQSIETKSEDTNCSQRSPIKKTKKNCRTKRKTFSVTRQIKKTLQGKLPSEVIMCNDHDNDGIVTVASRNGDSEEGEDSTHSSSAIVTQGEPSLGSTILDEILGEKKKALLESHEMIEFLKHHISSKLS